MPTYIMKPTGYQRAPWCRYTTCTDLRIEHPEITRFKRKLGPFNEVEGTGRYDRKRITIRARGSVHAANGVERCDSHSEVASAPTTAAGVKAILRQLRPQEQYRIGIMDAEIIDAEKRLAELRDRRATLVAEAWTKAHVVPLKDVVANAVDGI